MVQALARHHRSIAWFLTTLFYLELVLVPAVAKANTRPLPYLSANRFTGAWNAPASAPLMPEKVAEKVSVKTEKKAPATIKGTFTTGPTQPEMQSFQSVNANNMVDLFTGDFTYNIPLLDVGGYPVNLHYQSGVTMDQDASWVGLGWNINPGVISRNMRGLPDDFMGEEDKVTKQQNVKPNRTLGVTIGANAELIGVTKLTNVKTNGDTVKGRATTLGVALGIFHNTYKGWGTEVGFNANINAGSTAKGKLSAGLAITNNSQTGLDISPSLSVRLNKEDAKSNGVVTIGTNYNSRMGIQNLQISGEVKRNNSDHKKLLNNWYPLSAGISFARPSYTPTISMPFTSSQFSFTAKVGAELWAFHPNFYIRGYTSNQRIEEDDRSISLPAYGYLNYDKAGSDQHVLLDFNREKDIAYTDNTPHIAIPVYTYDTYSISGEGTGGMFRPYRGDVGYVFDHSMTTKSNSNSLSVDVGFGNVVHGGIDFNKVYAATKSNPWVTDNRFTDVAKFRGIDTTYENVYFKNPGEKTSSNKTYLNAIGNDSLMRIDLTPVIGQNIPTVTASRRASLFKAGRAVGSTTFDLNSVRKARDKRTQVISWLNATEASHAGLDKQLRSYHINTFPASNCMDNFDLINRVDADRKGHHISEMTVLNADGRRYIYGLPVYNKEQLEVTMSTKKGDVANGLVNYTANDYSYNNDRGKDGYLNKEKLPAYAHSFLLTGILSTDYVDITGDGITEDDQGAAVKFNYTQAYNLVDPYKWRAPYQADQAAYNEGLKTDSSDDKGSFSYGRREVWLLNSVESKTMMATFVLDTETRQDAFGVNNEYGGRNAAQKLYRLKEINLYTKADYLKNGIANAKPIKTVHFDYSYELCPGNPGSDGNTGKLTLKKIWFTYNKNNKGKRNPYVFAYHATNPAFSSKAVDRWGNYKDPAGNPGTTGQEMTNADYPYALQTGVKTWDSAKAATNAAPWALSEVKLPSGGKIKVTYESDDYAYVQNKRAMQFFSIAGFASSSTAAITSQLYRPNTSGTDYHFVFVNVTESVSNKTDIERKYLEGVKQLYFKIAVNMPGDDRGSGFELVPVYADIEDYGVRNGNNKMIWIRVKAVNGDESPFATAAVQFLRLNLPYKVFKYSEPGDNLDIRAAAGMLASVADNVKNTINGFDDQARDDNHCNTVVPGKSFIRLDNPVYKKLGGGLRVQKVELFDNWNAMSGQTQSVYGQTYDYSTVVDVNGIATRISSGVATYEPSIGNDENPFKVPNKLYAVKVGALVPADNMYTEDPLGETFFPAPSVGYSKVRVQTIHKDKKSANGFDDTEFYTAKDFPVIVEYTPLDNESKKRYDPPIANFLKFDARHYVTLSQGFKVELNDMHGRMKSNASYSQNDLKKPISYTYNYYRVKNDNAAQPALSNTVAVADSANGIIDTTGEIGKDVELMIDVREQTSFTISGSLEANFDWAHPFPAIIIPSAIPLPSMETNRYRAIALLKVVNRYGILDSVIHIEKGSKVTTRNVLYDGETGDVLLTQTNNEFDDPVYNFSYPAHWAYTGMGPAYRNIGTVLKGVAFRSGIMYESQNGHQRVPVERYFESGDELLVRGQDKRSNITDDQCSPYYYFFNQEIGYKKIWAVDASKGKEGQKGIYFVDRDGIPYSCNAVEVKIIRSGKRNMPGTPVGSVSSLGSPLKEVSGKTRIVFDASTDVVGSSASRFKDFWKVDSTGYAKDTTVISARRVYPQTVTISAIDHYTMADFKNGGGGNRHLEDRFDETLFEASSFDGGSDHSDEHKKSWLLFNISQIPQGAVIQSATLYLYGAAVTLHGNFRNSNAGSIERLKAGWPKTTIPSSGGTRDPLMIAYFHDNQTIKKHDYSTSVPIAATPANAYTPRDESLNVTNLMQGMVDDYYNWGGTIAPGIRIRLVDPFGAEDFKKSRLSYNTEVDDTEECSLLENTCDPYISVTFVERCLDGTAPTPGFQTFTTVPVTPYWCYDTPTDSIVCKPNINDTAVNFYRFGILGNWRLDRAYTYYDRREQSDPLTKPRLRTDGVINNYAPYWNFTNGLLTPSTDTMRWVWNSEMTMFNNKGMEIENHDPLDRYNAGQYGYNQTLPVALTQNSRNRESVFDGFEDYGYRTDTCKHCLTNRFIDMAGDGELVDTMSHTGMYSLRLNGNQNVAKEIPIGTIAQDTISPKLSMKEDSIPLIDTSVVGTGSGLGNYFYTQGGGCWDYQPGRPPQSLGVNSTVDYYTYGRHIPNVCGSNRDQGIDYSFTGYIQPRHTGVYKFWLTADHHAHLYITRNGVSKHLCIGSPVEEEHDGQYDIAFPMDTMYLQAGEFYSVVLLWYLDQRPYHMKLEWESQGLQSQGREIVPLSQLYPVETNLATAKQNTVSLDTAWCVKFAKPTAEEVTHNPFSPMQGKKVVVSAWVKQETPCVNGNYDNAQLVLNFNNSGVNQFILKPSGSIIEGWQRIEDTLTIPATATNLTLNMQATSGTPVFFDDIRIHPYHANMKSYVYNPVNLRLMAELDENNYATFYEYDDEGTLIRLKKETERGVKTIKETRNALMKD